MGDFGFNYFFMAFKIFNFLDGFFFQAIQTLLDFCEVLDNLLIRSVVPTRGDYCSFLFFGQPFSHKGVFYLPCRLSSAEYCGNDDCHDDCDCCYHDCHDVFPFVWHPFVECCLRYKYPERVFSLESTPSGVY